MRHKKGNAKLGLPTDQRIALLKSLTKSLIQYKKIETTDVRAKQLKRFIEPLITIAKNDTVHARRKVFSVLQDKSLIKELFQNVVKPFMSTNGGYVTVKKKGRRRGDNALMSLVQFSS